MKTVFEVRCHEWGDGSDYLIASFSTKRQAEEYVEKRNRQRPLDQLYEHWYVRERHQEADKQADFSENKEPVL